MENLDLISFDQMNETFSTILKNNFSSIRSELWFIPIDILTIICILIGIIFSMIFLIIIIFDQKCHTVSMLLTGNSSLVGFLFGLTILSMRLFTFHNDLKRISYEDIFCSFRGYLGYVICSIQNCSYLLQSIYRFVSLLYPSCWFWHSFQTQFFFICLTWLFGFLYPIGFLLNNQILYNIDNQICQLPLNGSFSIVYMANFAYITPVLLTMFIYFKLVRYVQEMSHRVTPTNALFRAKRELRMVRRTVTLLLILFILCFPYATFLFLSFLIIVPTYHFRIAYIFLDLAYLCVICALFQFTHPVKSLINKRIHSRSISITSGRPSR